MGKPPKTPINKPKPNKPGQKPPGPRPGGVGGGPGTQNPPDPKDDK